MHPQHTAARLFRNLTRQSLITRSFSFLSIPLLVLVWIYAIRKGERQTFKDHIEACAWSSWEDWPAGAAPHHLVFVADPQIVDPHTYPGRPWPLSSLTERYTDRYMRRNFQLINERLDPDSVVFLGDLFDGGREWATHASKPLKPSQRRKLERLQSKANEEDKAKQKEEEETHETQSPADPEGGTQDDGVGHSNQKRSWESYDIERHSTDHPSKVRREDHNLDRRGNDLKEFVYGENGRWKKWGMNQWNEEYDRFGKMFFAPDQLYPRSQRRTIAAWDVNTHPINVMNGAKDVNREEHAVIGGKYRRLLTSLPGNHDVGFGSGVQLTVRDRFQARFGEANRVDILGNHSFVSLDAPSLAAYNEFTINGQAPPGTVEERTHIWKPAMDFLDDVGTAAATAVAENMADYYPDQDVAFKHTVGDTKEKVAPKSGSYGKLPVVLLTHEPLYRDPGTDCGPLRERGHAISISGGYQYQNTLTRDLSNTVAQRVSNAGEIAHIFSGDDHDYCDVWHRYNVGNIGENRSPKPTTVRETTVKSFSWAMGVRKPGFQLLSMWNPIDENGQSMSAALPTVQTHMCLLPDQIGILINYGKLAGLTIVILLARAVLIAMRGPDTDSTGEEADTLSDLALPRFRPRGSPNGSANGYSTPNKSEFKGRQRASSTGLKSFNDTQSLGVQRSYTSRTRSVSPAPGNEYNSPSGGLPNVPLIEKAGLYLSAPYESDDEESNMGDFGDDYADSQGKSRRRRGLTRPRVAFNEFVKGLGIVGGFGVVLYLYKIWSW